MAKDIIQLRLISEKINHLIEQGKFDRKSPSGAFSQGYFIALEEIKEIINDDNLTYKQSFCAICDYIDRQKKYNNIPRK